MNAKPESGTPAEATDPVAAEARAFRFLNKPNMVCDFVGGISPEWCIY
jgi:hypothetical protein